MSPERPRDPRGSFPRTGAPRREPPRAPRRADPPPSRDPLPSDEAPLEQADVEGRPLFGRNPVLELLRAGSRRVEEIAIVSEGRGPALHDLLNLARRQGVKISFRTRDQLTAMAGDPHHQGVVARVAGASYSSLGDLLTVPAGRGEVPFFLALDQVQDPRNLGAVLRSAEVTGVHGVILPKHHAVGLTGAAAKSAMGAAELVAVARETNLVQALEELKKEGVWIVGAIPTGGKVPWGMDLTGPLCLVLGGEGEGLRPLVARSCDFLTSLPMRGRLGSLNVSAAAAVLCYEVLRQRGRGERT
ncbi:MAG TPA: 23S rRNA (guanosine(2251)-2'-O)-methyltransferase RlmB [Methylomirabilota bacterium]|nr:23S rRNA (guanosine(2251)-2'-O)-methyltransferase RlmB [Methylomirabilota bacterium]